MIIIGEKLNSSIKSVKEAIENKDEAFLKELSIAQKNSGATYLDVNVAVCDGDELENLLYLADIAKKSTSLPLSIDTPSIKTAKGYFEKTKDKNIILNSITYETSRFLEGINFVKETQISVVILLMNDNGIPKTVEERMQTCDDVMKKVDELSIPHNKIYFDPMVEPAGVYDGAPLISIETIRKIKEKYPNVHIACGLSNVSHGMPKRALLNRAFLCGAVMAGLDSPILNPMDKKLMSFFYAAKAIAGQDEYCADYIEAFRDDLLED